MFIPGGFGGYILIMVVGMLISGAAALWVRSSYSKFSKQRSASGLTGQQTARMILDRNGLSNVKVEPVAGQLTDHYDPRSKVIRLSEDNYSGNSIAGVSVAAHEVGHAIQDAGGYLPMRLRAGIFPVVNFSSQIWPMAFIMAFFVGGAATDFGSLLINIAIVMFMGVLAFHVVTLPVEINASTRAYGLLTRYGILSGTEAAGTRRVLTAAAFTYIAAALTAVLTFLYLLAASRQ
ncbi:probable metal-dependent peptidase [uncultured Rubrobacteraceae bacterium]|uniref:Probable metal-dependent peptidase n=1 Tax=uncultured Rubrobacteraceae bacterium TaxID=349277 RepID=A0A6J4PZP4_9ACTN|nr:probable metal-dependent peptidase [uncultured Rubrobacteraceae bacterium]